MAEDVDLKELEKKAWTSVSQDGLWEVVIGIYALASTIGCTLMELGASDVVRWVVVYPMLFMGAPILLLGKRYMTVPRTGMVVFSQHRQNRALIMMVIILAGLMVTMGTWYAIQYHGLDGSTYGFIMISALVFTVFCAIAYYFGQPRFYVMAILMGSGEPTLTYLRSIDIQFAGTIAWGIPAIIILLMGITTMYKFLKKYPLPSKEDGEENPNAV